VLLDAARRSMLDPPERFDDDELRRVLGSAVSKH